MAKKTKRPAVKPCPTPTSCDARAGCNGACATLLLRLLRRSDS